MQVRERMISVSKLKELRIRFWIAVDDQWQPSEAVATAEIEAKIAQIQPGMTVEQVADFLGQNVANCNAVEVLDHESGCGTLLYPSWP